MLAQGVAVGEALVAVLAGEALGAVVEGFYMSAEGEPGAIGLWANRTLKLFHLLSVSHN